MNDIIKISMTKETLNDLIKMFNRQMNSHNTYHSARIEGDKILISSTSIYKGELMKNEQAIIIPFKEAEND